MSPPLPIRWVIVGNSGSGKSTLAERLGQILHRPIYDLDLVHWQPDGRKRDEADARARVAEIAATGSTAGSPRSPWCGRPGLSGSTSRGTRAGPACSREACGAA